MKADITPLKAVGGWEVTEEVGGVEPEASTLVLDDIPSERGVDGPLAWAAMNSRGLP